MILQTSVDGEKWTERSLRHKPGDPTRRRGWPRTSQDWQMWFARIVQREPWLIRAHKLLREAGRRASADRRRLRFREKFIRAFGTRTRFERGGTRNAWWVRDEGQGEVCSDRREWVIVLGVWGWGTGDFVGLISRRHWTLWSTERGVAGRGGDSGDGRIRVVPPPLWRSTFFCRDARDSPWSNWDDGETQDSVRESKIQVVY